MIVNNIFKLKMEYKYLNKKSKKKEEIIIDDKLYLKLL